MWNWGWNRRTPYMWLWNIRWFRVKAKKKNFKYKNIKIAIHYRDIIVGVTDIKTKDLILNRRKVNKLILIVKWIIWKSRISLTYEDKWVTIYVLWIQIDQEINSIMVQWEIVTLINFIYVYILNAIKWSQKHLKQLKTQTRRCDSLFATDTGNDWHWQPY